MVQETKGDEFAQSRNDTALDFLNDVKQGVLKEQPQRSKSLYVIAFDVVESYFGLQKYIDTQHKPLRNAKPAGSGITNGFYALADEKEVGLDVDGEFEIVVRQNGEIIIRKSPFAQNEQDDYLIQTANGQIGSVSIHPVTQETEPPLDPVSNRHLHTMLQFVNGYYRLYSEAIPQAASWSKNMQLPPPPNSELFPKFPQQEIRQLKTLK